LLDLPLADHCANRSSAAGAPHRALTDQAGSAGAIISDSRATFPEITGSWWSELAGY
jgi:hypothetical protein